MAAQMYKWLSISWTRMKGILAMPFVYIYCVGGMNGGGSVPVL